MSEPFVLPVIMPKASMSMDSGIVLEFFKTPGDTVKKGEPLFLIETDKVAMEVEAEYSGVLLKWLVKEGQSVAVAEPVAYIESFHFTATAIKYNKNTPATPASTVYQRKKAKSRSFIAGCISDRKKSHGFVLENTQEKNLVKKQSIRRPSINLPNSTSGKVKSYGNATPLEKVDALRATPDARRVAKIFNIDLKDIQARRPHGDFLDDGFPITGSEVHYYNGTYSKSIREGVYLEEATSSEMVTPSDIVNGKVCSNEISQKPVCLKIYVKVSYLLRVLKKYNDINFSNITLADCVVKSCTIAWKHFGYLLQKNHMQEDYERANQTTVPLLQDLNIQYLNCVSGSRALLRNISGIHIRSLSSRLLSQEHNCENYEFHSKSIFSVIDMSSSHMYPYTPLLHSCDILALGIGAIENFLDKVGGEVVEQKRVCLSLMFLSNTYHTVHNKLLQNIKENIEDSSIFH